LLYRESFGCGPPTNGGCSFWVATIPVPLQSVILRKAWRASSLRKKGLKTEEMRRFLLKIDGKPAEIGGCVYRSAARVVLQLIHYGRVTRFEGWKERLSQGRGVGVRGFSGWILAKSKPYSPCFRLHEEGWFGGRLVPSQDRLGARLLAVLMS